MKQGFKLLIEAVSQHSCDMHGEGKNSIMVQTRKYFGDRDFYKKVLYVALPIMIQNGFTNFVNLLDNLMVGRIGTEQMSGVSIVNQLLFVFNLSIFGALSGAGIFIAQYFGSGDRKSMKYVFRMKILVAVAILLVGLGVLFFARTPLISLFLHEGSETGDLVATLGFAEQYILIMLIGLFPFTICQCYASTLRETGETILPMKAGIVAVLVNLSLNYVLIYGKLGFPVLGVRGAAIATVVSRVVECSIVVIWCMRKREKCDYMLHIFRQFRIPGQIAKNVIVKGMPLLVNEFLWSAAMTTLAFCYSTRGLDAVAGINICNTLNNVFSIGLLALGSSVSIIVGQLLGAGKFEEAKDSARKMMIFSALFCAVLGVFMAIAAPFFPLLYETEDAVRRLATSFILIMACLMPFSAYTNASYFTLRSGGKTGITFLFDSCYAWGICVATAAVLAFFTDIPVVPLYLICQSLEVIKSVIGHFLVKKGVWIQNLSDKCEK